MSAARGLMLAFVVVVVLVIGAEANPFAPCRTTVDSLQVQLTLARNTRAQCEASSYSSTECSSFWANQILALSLTRQLQECIEKHGYKQYTLLLDLVMQHGEDLKTLFLNAHSNTMDIASTNFNYTQQLAQPLVALVHFTNKLVFRQEGPSTRCQLGVSNITLHNAQQQNRESLLNLSTMTQNGTDLLQFLEHNSTYKAILEGEYNDLIATISEERYQLLQELFYLLHTNLGTQFDNLHGLLQFEHANFQTTLSNDNTQTQNTIITQFSVTENTLTTQINITSLELANENRFLQDTLVSNTLDTRNLLQSQSNATIKSISEHSNHTRSLIDDATLNTLLVVENQSNTSRSVVHKLSDEAREKHHTQFERIQQDDEAQFSSIVQNLETMWANTIANIEIQHNSSTHLFTNLSERLNTHLHDYSKGQSLYLLSAITSTTQDLVGVSVVNTTNIQILEQESRNTAIRTYTNETAAIKHLIEDIGVVNPVVNTREEITISAQSMLNHQIPTPEQINSTIKSIQQETVTQEKSSALLFAAMMGSMLANTNTTNEKLQTLNNTMLTFFLHYNLAISDSYVLLWPTVGRIDTFQREYFAMSRTIVHNTVNYFSNSFGTNGVGFASYYLQNGESAYNSNNYRSAMKFYRLAYRAATS